PAPVSQWGAPPDARQVRQVRPIPQRPTFLWPATPTPEKLKSMSDSTGVVVGIDGGATYSFGVAVDLTGRARAAAKAGSLNFFGTSLQEARRSLTQLMRTLEVALPLGNELVYTVIGSAALFSEAAPREKELLCRGIVPLE